MNSQKKNFFMGEGLLRKSASRPFLLQDKKISLSSAEGVKMLGVGFVCCAGIVTLLFCLYRLIFGGLPAELPVIKALPLPVRVKVLDVPQKEEDLYVHQNLHTSDTDPLFDSGPKEVMQNMSEEVAKEQWQKMQVRQKRPAKQQAKRQVKVVHLSWRGQKPKKRIPPATIDRLLADFDGAEKAEQTD